MNSAGAAAVTPLNPSAASEVEAPMPLAAVVGVGLPNGLTLFPKRLAIPTTTGLASFEPHIRVGMRACINIYVHVCPWLQGAAPCNQ